MCLGIYNHKKIYQEEKDMQLIDVLDERIIDLNAEATNKDEEIGRAHV